MAGQIVDRRVAPLIASGLHCGHSSTANVNASAVAPLIASGLHCGVHPAGQLKVGDLGRPAHRERAPLRRWLRADEEQVRPGRPAHRERAPLRHELRRWRTWCAVMVAPLIASGLHCGTRSYPASTTALPVAPLIASGLHCGDLDLSHTGHPGPVAPLIASGLHCGTRPVPADALTRLVAPLIASGLHCGPEVVLVCETGGRSPRSSRAGSIAAHSEPTGTG